MCAPDPPDYSATAQASEKVGLEQVELGREQLAWAKQMGQEQLNLARDVVGTQVDIMRENQRLAVEDRGRYRSTFGPLEDALVEEAKAYATPERAEQEASRASSDVVQAYDKARSNMLRQQAAFGIDPTSGMAMANDRLMGVGMAKDMAHSANTARRQVEDMGWAKKLDAVSLGKGLPAQASTAYGIATNAGNSAVGNMNNTAGTIASNMASAQNWYQGGLQGIGQAANIMHMGHQDAVASANANMRFIGGLTGAGLGFLGTRR